MTAVSSMTDRTTRLYAVVIAVLVFVVSWAVVAARPWAPRDPRSSLLAQREQLLRSEARYVRMVTRARAAAAVASAQRQLAAAAPAPAVRVVNLPPLTVTRTS